jgi:iron(III) transport system permease protein
MTPYVVPGTVIGIGLVAAFNEAPLLLTGTWFILFLSFTVRHLPYTVKACEASLYRLHKAQEEAALGLGATPFRAFRTIIVPALVPGLVTGASLAFLHAMTELSSTIVLFRPPWKPITAVIFENAVTTGADFGYAAALATVLMVMIYVPLWLVHRARNRLGGINAGGF